MKEKRTIIFPDLSELVLFIPCTFCEPDDRQSRFLFRKCGYQNPVTP